MAFHRVALAVLLTVALAACGNDDDEAPSENSEAAVARAFSRWNEFARRGEPQAAGELCRNPEPPDDHSSPIDSAHRGFRVAGELNINVDGDTAIVDFLDPGQLDADKSDDSDVFVTLVKDSGAWKVCRAQITAPGGFG